MLSKWTGDDYVVHEVKSMGACNLMNILELMFSL